MALVWPCHWHWSLGTAPVLAPVPADVRGHTKPNLLWRKPDARAAVPRAAHPTSIGTPMTGTLGVRGERDRRNQVVADQLA